MMLEFAIILACIQHASSEVFLIDLVSSTQLNKLKAEKSYEDMTVRIVKEIPSYIAWS